MDKKENKKVEDVFVADEIVEFLDLLAQYDYEDKQKEKSALKPDSPASAPGSQV